MQSLSIGCDAHKHYSQLEVKDANGQVLTRALSLPSSHASTAALSSHSRASAIDTGSPTRSKPLAVCLCSPTPPRPSS
jgi:hypothetical protein